MNPGRAEVRTRKRMGQSDKGRLRAAQPGWWPSTTTGLILGGVTFLEWRQAQNLPTSIISA